MNLFKPCFQENTFDVVISNGCLHHTSNPKKAFSSISKLAKSGGYIVIGLYHKMEDYLPTLDSVYLKCLIIDLSF